MCSETNTLEVKNLIKQELLKNSFPNFEVLFNEKSLNISLELLNELLDEEKKDFEKDLELPLEKINFETFFDKESILDIYWSFLSHYYSVNSDEKIRKIIEEFEPSLIDYWHFVSYNKKYYEICKYILEETSLDYEQKRIVKDVVEKFEERWINLKTEKQNKLKKISKKLAKLSNKFSNNEIDSEKTFSYTFSNLDFLQELPNSIAESVKSEKWYTFWASPSDYSNVMKYCSSREIREFFYKKHSSFASSWKFDNKKNILQIINLRKEKAEILWYNSFNELAFVHKMADSKEEVEVLIKPITKKAKQKARKELYFLKKYFKLCDIHPWDLPYFYRKLKETKYKLNEQEVKKYFEFNNVLSWLFGVAKKLFGLEMKEVSKKFSEDNFFSDCKFYEVWKDWEKIAFYMLDPFYRKEKNSWAWANDLKWKFKEKLPFIINVCNFEKPRKQELSNKELSEENFSLLSLWEVETIFHEFGHATHQMLAKSKYPELSWFWVEWDFVEVPSQFLEHWVSEKESVKLFAKHFETEEEIPETFLETFEKLKNLWIWLNILSQNRLTFLDFKLHWDKVPQDVESLEKKVKKVFEKYRVFEKKDTQYNSYCTFGHIFDWSYASGYYSYIRAEIMELNIFSEFRKNWIFDEKTAKKYREKILEAWSSKDAKDLFFDFMWKWVNLEVFYENKGL